MKTIAIILVLSICEAAFSAGRQNPVRPAPSGQNIVTSAQVNGTWRYQHNEFKVLALGKQQLQVEFSGVYEYKTPSGPSANLGDASGIAHIDGERAVLKYNWGSGPDEGCTITMEFKEGKLIVTTDGDCGFGHNVTADGTYRRISSRKPKFEPDDK